MSMRAIAFLVVFCAPVASRAQEQSRNVFATPHFAFFSDFETNLNDALTAAATARNADTVTLFDAGPERDCFSKLPPSAQEGWKSAVGYYAQRITSPRNRSQQNLVRMQLAGFDAELSQSGAREFADSVRRVRSTASAAYRACRWSTQDSSNRKWAGELRERLGLHESAIAKRLARLYRKEWSGIPIRVDVVETVDWSGANSFVLDDGGGHILISTSNAGPSGLEIVFHEASHLLMTSGAPVRAALDSASRASRYRPAPDLWHVVLFYTTGEVVKRELASEAGVPYVPAVYEIFGRSNWVDYRSALETHWLPYVEEKRGLTDAAHQFIQAIRDQLRK